MTASLETQLATAPLPDGSLVSDELLAQGIHYFRSVVTEEQAAMDVHRLNGQAWKYADGSDFRGARVHSVLQAGRMEVMARLLDFDPDVRREARTAALLHDGGKRPERQYMIEQGLSPESYLAAGERYHAQLLQLGFSKTVVAIASSVGHESIDDMNALADTPVRTWSDHSIACALMNMLDNHARHHQWAQPARTNLDGTRVNQLDDRMAQNADNAVYQAINEAGYPLYGRSMYEQQAISGHAIERCIASLVLMRTGIMVNPLDLPTFVDQELISHIRRIPVRDTA